jgi:HD-like signal output (HDOD) protein
MKEIAYFLRSEYDVFIAEKSEEALRVINDQKIDMIYTDINITAPDGSPFLIRVKESRPEMIRALLGDGEDDEAVVDALNRNIAKACIFKPWKAEKVLRLTNQIFEAERRLEEVKLLSVVNNLSELPTIKASYQRIIQLIDADAEVDDIVAAIESDPAISAKILRVANSAYYGVRTASIKRAFMYLGFKSIRDLILSASIFDIFNLGDLPDRVFQPLWQQAFISSKIIHTIYRMLRKKTPVFATSAGVLMNIGIVFFTQCFTADYIKLIQEVKQSHGGGGRIKLEDLEMEKYGINHSLAGGYLLNWWGMPFQIVEAALYHHSPFDENVINREYMCILHIAEHYSAKFLHYDNHSSFDEGTLGFLGISQEDLERRLSEVMV